HSLIITMSISQYLDSVLYSTLTCPTQPPSTLNFFFFNDPATTEIYTLSLHDALPISTSSRRFSGSASSAVVARSSSPRSSAPRRSEEHTSELQSRGHLVCRLLLEKKKNIKGE